MSNPVAAVSGVFNANVLDGMHEQTRIQVGRQNWTGTAWFQPNLILGAIS
ncbi:hypothetical protein [Parasedimentitalea marina]|nr:hypothetical protein [Parasedimentitalea marina]